MLRTIRVFTYSLWSLLAIFVLMAPNKLFGHVGDTLLQIESPTSLPNCTEMFVDISTACLVPCTSSDYFVKYCNLGDETALNASVSVTFDSTFTINSASFPFTDQGNNVFLFQIGDVPAGDCGSFSININLDCDVEIGQAHCVDAQIFPQSTCTPTSPNWDGSDIGLTIECQGDSIYFTLINTGTGDMSQPSQCIIIEDDLIVMVSGYYLPAGGDTTIAWPNNGGAYHFEAGLTVGNPNGFFAERSIEGCTDISTGYLPQFPDDDGIPGYEESCMVNDTICHFNKKIAFPIGAGNDHDISAEIPIQYQINFQNTTPDTVTTLTVCDTLSSFLDTSTLIAGASSHDYVVQNLGNNVFKFVFNNINLPPGGFGFVKFQVGQRADNPTCARIENWARIFFDQTSILTDTVFHTSNCSSIIIDTTISFCNGGGYYLGNFYSQNGTFSNTTNFSTTTSQLNTNILVFPGTADETIEATICEGETYEVGGQTFNTSGTFSIPMTDENGCPYTLTLILTVEENVEVISFQEICQGGTYPFFGQNLSVSGTYSHVEPNGNCFKIDILVLTVNPTYFHRLDSTICQGDTMLWEGLILSSDTMLSHTYTSINGCDSVSALNLVVTPNFDISIDTAICEGETYFIGPNGYNTAGTYTDTLQTIHFCDSIVTVNLSILPNSSAGLAAVICEGETYQIGSSIFTQSGTYVVVLPSANGCDSTVTLELIVQAKDSTCFAFAGLDTAVCGFTWPLMGNPSPGVWEVVCSASAGEVSFTEIGDSTATANVSECGTYFFKYTHVHFDTLLVLDSMTMSFDTIIDTCMVSDFIQVDFEDPSFRQISVSVDIDLVYNDYTCGEDDGVTCSNIYPFEAVTPIPSWKFSQSASCNSDIITPVAGEPISACLVDTITYEQTGGSASSNLPPLCLAQADFLELDSNGQTVLDNDFFELLDSLWAAGWNSIDGQCPPAPSKCFAPPPCPPGILGYDTIMLAIPVHLGGHWTYIDSLSQNVPLTDTSILSINNIDFALVITPNAHTYSPVNFELWRVFPPNDSLAAPGSAVDVTVQWQELWAYDTIQRIIAIPAPLPDSCAPICPPQGGSSFGFSDIPNTPSFDCPPFTITFEGTTLVLTDSIVCDTYNYTVYIKVTGGTPPYSLTGLAGNFISQNIFESEPLPSNMGYTATVSDSAGCEAAITGEPCRCMIYEASSPPLVEANCVDSCVVLVGTPIGNGNNWLAQWCDESGVIATGTTVTVCETGTYFFKVIDQLTGCVDSSMTDVFVQFPIAEAGPNRVITCTQSFVTLLGDELTGDAPIAFSWTGPGINPSNQNQQQPQVAEPGTYTLTVTNLETGCTDTDNVAVSNDLAMPNAVISPPATLNCFNPNQTLFGNQSTPVGQISYTWSTIVGNFTTGPNFANVGIDQGGVYTLVVTDQSSGCTDMAQVNVLEDFTPPASVNAGPSMQLDCDHDMQTLQGSVGDSNGLSINWTTTNGHIAEGENTLSPLVDEPGFYSLTIQNTNNGCSATDTTTVTADFNLPLALIEVPDTLNCVDTLLELSGQGSTTGTDISYHWQTTEGQIVEDSNLLVTTVAAPGTYYLTVLDASNGCETTDTVQVAENIAAPIAQAGLDSYFSCATDSLKLNGNASDSSANLVYHWIALSGQFANGTNTKTPWVSEPGEFVLVVTDTTNGCQALDSVTIAAYEPVSFNLVMAPDCQGTDVGSVIVNDLQGQADSYFYELDNGQVWYDSLITGLPAGDYTLTVLDQDSCAVEADFSILEVPPLPALSFEEEYHFCGEDNPLSLDASVAIDSQWVSYLWSNGETTPNIITTEEGTLSLEVATVCETNTYEMVIIDDLRKREFFEVPNAFSPNSDNINDQFGPVTPHELDDFEMVIFDRWGNKVFSTDDMNNLWDGTYKGKAAASDVYIFKVYATYMDCLGLPFKISKKGDVTLLR